jgi:hypothetical protein
MSPRDPVGFSSSARARARLRLQKVLPVQSSQLARRVGRLPHSARRRMRHHHLRSAQDRHPARRRQPCPAASRDGCAACFTWIGRPTGTPQSSTRSRWGCSGMTSSQIWKSASRRDYPMSTPTDGRGRGGKADVPGNPVVDRPAVGAAGTDMRSAGSDTTNDDSEVCLCGHCRNDRPVNASNRSR